MLHWLLYRVLKVGMLLQAFLEKGDDLALEVRLASEGNLLASISLKKLESRFALLVARET